MIKRDVLIEGVRSSVYIPNAMMVGVMARSKKEAELCMVHMMIDVDDLMEENGTLFRMNLTSNISYKWNN